MLNQSLKGTPSAQKGDRLVFRECSINSLIKKVVCPLFEKIFTKMPAKSPCYGGDFLSYFVYKNEVKIR